MAGDWMKLELCTLDKPEILAIAAKLSIDPDLAFAKCVRVWAWFDQHTKDGYAKGVTKITLDALSRCNGLTEAMFDVGWIDVSEQGIRLPNFERHNGETAKKRALNAKRQGKYRDKDNDQGVTKITQEALPREEKRREERTTSASSEKISLSADGSWQNISENQRQVWQRAYPALSLDAELTKAAAWILANPKNKKSNYARFLNGWLTKAQDRAPRSRASEFPWDGAVQ